MIRSTSIKHILWFILALSLLLASCGGGGSNSSVGTGTLELGLTDASSKDYQAVYVTIAEVQVKKQNEGDGEAGWETIMTPEQTYNLLELVNGRIANLGVGELEVGRYGQIRLILDGQPDTSENILNAIHPHANYLIDEAGNSIELKVPSGYQTGIKIVKGFTIVASQATSLVLDFNAAKSVVMAGKSGKILLKPTIKVLETVENSIGGVVDNGVDPIAGALISAQINDSSAADFKDEVTVESATVSTTEGAYKLFLPPDIYNIVATRDGYLPACKVVEAQFYEGYTAEFNLKTETEIITISGSVSGLATEEDSTLLSIRQAIDCGAGNVTVEVASISVAEGGNFSITLPAGTYDMIASAAGATTQIFEDIIEDIVLDIVFGQ